MKAIMRRLRRLEDRFGPPVETGFSPRLLKRVEEGRRRLAEAKERGEWCGSVGNDEGEKLAGLSMTEIHHLGRARVTRAK
jgi:hypothetical protein